MRTLYLCFESFTGHFTHDTYEVACDSQSVDEALYNYKYEEEMTEGPFNEGEKEEIRESLHDSISNGIYHYDDVIAASFVSHADAAWLWWQYQEDNYD